MESYRRVGNLLSILKSKARLTFKNHECGTADVGKSEGET